MDTAHAELIARILDGREYTPSEGRIALASLHDEFVRITAAAEAAAAVIQRLQALDTREVQDR